MARNRDALWSNGRDESVEVNQRALVDKVLARYSGEFTVFRELLQNSDDAQSSAAEIRFETHAYLLRKGSEQEIIDPPLPDLNSTSVAQWTFRNNGIIFRDEDWTRLRRIGEGNPDEEKIGAFGVGFYSLFSITESPLVLSGGHAMEFYWKDNKDQLKVRRGDLPAKGIADPWTTFEMKLRQAAPIPPLLDILRFLASSITFMTHLNNVSVCFDEHRIGHVKKSSGMAKDVDIPSTLKRSSGSKIMNVRSVNSRPIRIEAEFPDPPNAVGAAQLTLTMFTAEVDVKVEKTLSAELLRSTKKRPPARIKYHMIYTGKAQYDQSLSDSKKQPAAGGTIFRGLHADLDGATNTRIFIGHATGQTTGIGGHMASYFIPTVERECLDLVDRNTAMWNKELFYVGGFLSRVVYDLELSAIDNAWTSATDGIPGLQPHRDLQADFLHTLKFFAFHRSTPSPEVGQLLEASFYGCSSAPLRMLSSIGVREASSIKKYDSVLAEFLKDVPMLSSIVSECEYTIPILQETIYPVLFPDVVHNLRQNPLNMEKLVSCLRWWIKFRRDVSDSRRAELLGAIVFTNVDGSSIPLSLVQYFMGPRTFGDDIPQDFPLPSSILPRDVSRGFKPEQLGSFGWGEFSVIDWLQHISNPQVVLTNPAYVLSILSRVWKADRSLVKRALANKICIPTSCGLRTPKHSYFPEASTDLFRDLELPTVQFSSVFQNTKDVEALLLFIGVRKHINPQLILHQMSETDIWNTPALMRYLVQVRTSLTEDEFIELRDSAIFASPNSANRCCVRDLYVPTEVMRRLQLPVIAWDQSSKWSDGSKEAGILFHLGLRRFPSLETLMDVCSSKDAEVRATVFRYLCDNLSSKYPDYRAPNFANVPFVPAENNGVYRLEKLGNVFLDPQWKGLGFSVIQDEFREAPTSWLGIQQHPSSIMLLSRLEKIPPPDEAIAREWFEILLERVAFFSSAELACLSELPIVPIINSSGVRTWLAPTQCYLGDGTRDDFYSKLFVFVDFGSAANRFLSASGSRNEPSIADIAESLVEDPKRFYLHAGGHENFLTQLRNLAVNKDRIPEVTFDKMKSGPILLGKKADSFEEYYTHELRSPKEVIVADDVNAYCLLRSAIFTAPQEQLLEDFYLSLGCQRLSSVVQEECEILVEILDTKTSTHVRTLVLERLALFLHECTNTTPKIALDWLSDAENFKVRICKNLSISTNLSIGDEKTTRSRSAGAKRDDQGRIELWVSQRYDEPDMYEISISLCRLLFGSVRFGESLLFTTILSTDLEALRRRGCNVDLILKRRQIEPDGPIGDDDSSSHVTASEASEPSVAPTCPEPPRLSPGGMNLLQDSNPVDRIPTPRPPPHELKHSTLNRISSMTRKIFSRVHSPQARKSFQSLWTRQHVIPPSDIRASIDIAINACNSEGGQSLRHANNIEITKQSDQHCCGVSRKSDHLKFVGEVSVSQGGSLGTIKVFATTDSPNLDTFLLSREGALNRFANIIVPVAQVYRLSTSSLNIFYDVGGGPIAFNQNGNLFFNLRYFEAWHDEDVRNGVRRQAQISWFFGLAHEIAHNLIKSHSPEHVFWFSAICEAHMSTLLQVLEPMARH